MMAQTHKPASASRRFTMRWSVVWFALDFAVPLAIFYGLTTAGAGLYVALVASAIVSSISAIVSLVRGGHRRVSIWTVLSLGALAISFVSGSERFLLAKESLLTATVGVWFLVSMRGARPLAYQFARPMLEGRFHFSRRPWEPLWHDSPRFRHIWRVSSAMWGVATLADAALRVVMAYTLPVQAVPAFSTALMIGTTLLMQVVTNVYYHRAGLWRITRGDPA